MEELAKKLAYLQRELKEHEDASNADEVVITLREAVSDRKKALEEAEMCLSNELMYYDSALTTINSQIKEVSGKIIAEWAGEKKTMALDAGTLKFTTRESLNVIDDVNLFIELYGHLAIKNLVENYLKGFNLTAVEKYMGVHDLPTGVAEIEYKTTVKLEQKSGHHHSTLCRRHML